MVPVALCQLGRQAGANMTQQWGERPPFPVACPFAFPLFPLQSPLVPRLAIDTPLSRRQGCATFQSIPIKAKSAGAVSGSLPCLSVSFHRLRLVAKELSGLLPIPASRGVPAAVASTTLGSLKPAMQLRGLRLIIVHEGDCRSVKINHANFSISLVPLRPILEYG